MLVCAVVLSACAQYKEAVSVNYDGQDGRIAIVSHRGFWKNEIAKKSKNSIASLVEAQKAGTWGSECDIHLTADGKIIVNHDATIDGLTINDCSFAELSSHKLNNGECRPSFENYLKQARKGIKKTKLVIEFKRQKTTAIEDELIAEAFKLLKKNRMLNPDRVMFISGSLYTCKQVAKLAPNFTNQYLSGNRSPKELASYGINGIDYNFSKLGKHLEWVDEAHKLGMSVNVWTVNKEEQMRQAVTWGVDAITTDEPLILRRVLGDREYRQL